MRKKPIETIMGLVVLGVAVLFLVFAFKVSDLQVVQGYPLNAKFMKVGGLSIGSDVRINGVKVGTVTSQKIDNEDYLVNVSFNIAPDVRLPKDSTVSIESDGLVGDKFVKIDPGKSKEFLAANDSFANTKDFKTIEDLVGEIIFMVTDEGKKDDE